MDDALLAAHIADDDVRMLAASLARQQDGIDLAYEILDKVTVRHRLDDAHLVLRPEPLGSQVFRHNRLAMTAETACELASRPVGLYTVPDRVEPATRAALAGICNLALAATAARFHAAVDPATGLAGRPAIEAALGRAVARSARHGWACTAVLVATTGEGTPRERWSALCQALRAALRSGDEAGVAGGGRALVILGAAGPDVVRPFVARLRAALTDAGADGIDLVAATASAPRETVDPAELWSLANERLDAVSDRERGDSTAELSPLELELRAIPGVVGVGATASGVSGPLVLTVVVDQDLDACADAVARRVKERIPDAALSVVACGTGTSAGPQASIDDARAMPEDSGGPANGNHNGVDHGPIDHSPLAPRQLSANAPRNPNEANRVRLLSATFDAGSGVSEVRLGRGTARGTGRASAGPLAGGAQATLTALGGLGAEVPFYVVSAERARTVPGEPVVVVLAPRRTPSGATRAPAGERIGVAGGAEDVEAAARATLGALNRYLAPTAERE